MLDQAYKSYLVEMTLSRLTKSIQSSRVGLISPERTEMNDSQKRAAHDQMQKDLRRESDKGMVSFSGPHYGEYQYQNGQVSKEGSYIIRPGNHPKAGENFHRILTHLGNKYGQQSVLKVHKGRGAYHYMSGKVEPVGKVHYNKDLTKGSGDTKLKAHGSFSFSKD